MEVDLQLAAPSAPASLHVRDRSDRMSRPGRRDQQQGVVARFARVLQHGERL